MNKQMTLFRESCFSKSFILEYTAEGVILLFCSQQKVIFTQQQPRKSRKMETLDGSFTYTLVHVLSESLGFELRLLDWNLCIVRSHSFH